MNRVPIAPGQIPPENKIFREFGGINTQPSRQSINDNEFSWLENVMPIGFGNARALMQASAALATIAGGRTVYYAKEFNRTGTFYIFAACTDGSAWQVLASTPYTVTQIAAAGTFSGTSTQIAQWKNERILIIDTAANGYRDWNGAALTTLSGTTSAPAGGTCIAVYASKVWIVISASGSGRTISWSESGSYSDFTGSGGSTTIADDTLVSRIFQFLVANNFLYFFGSDSINVIADVTVSGGVTNFSNTNIVANSGTDLKNAIISYFRSVWYMNQSGVYALYGATPRKVSDALDGIFEHIDFTMPVTAGTVTLFNQLCAAFCFTYNDPDAGARQLIAIFSNKRWFLASQDNDPVGIMTQHGGSDTAWSFNGSSLYTLFTDSDDDIDQTLQTKLWDMGDFISIKETLAVGLEMITPAADGSVDLTVDTERYSVPPDIALGGSFAFTWTNSLGQVFSWLNSLGSPFTWLTSGYIWFQGNVQVQGHYLGITVESSTATNIYQGLQLQYRRLPAGWGT